MVEPSQMARYLASVAPQWRLAVGFTDGQLRTEVGGRSSAGDCWHATWTHSVRPTDADVGQTWTPKVVMP